MNYVYVAAILLSAHCWASTPEEAPGPPLKALFAEIGARPYTEHVYDCSNKAADYTRALDAAGYDATMMIVPTRRRDGETQLHAFVEIRELGTVMYADPTTGRWGRRIEDLSTPGMVYLTHPIYVLSPVILRRLQGEREYAPWDPTAR
jgi:hypothetical protein